MKANMNEVAKLSGVSVATVSNVINNTKYVSVPLRERVLKAIDELGYFPNLTARNLKTGSNKSIGIVVPDISNPVWAIIIETVENTLATSEYLAIIINTREKAEVEKSQIRHLCCGIVDGLIVASTLTDVADIKKNVPAGFPLVTIDRYLPDCPYDAIVPNDYETSYKGVSRLIEKGHRRIGFIASLMHLSTSQEKLSAYKNAMRDAGLSIEDAMIQRGDSRKNSAIPLVDKILEAGCSAIFVGNNVMLYDVLYYLRMKGMRIGTDIDVFGQGTEDEMSVEMQNIEYFVQPSREIGRLAAERIMRLLTDEETSPLHMQIKSQYVYRKSGPAAGGAYA